MLRALLCSKKYAVRADRNIIISKVHLIAAIMAKACILVSVLYLMADFFHG